MSKRLPFAGAVFALGLVAALAAAPGPKSDLPAKVPAEGVPVTQLAGQLGPRRTRSPSTCTATFSRAKASSRCGPGVA